MKKTKHGKVSVKTVIAKTISKLQLKDVSNIYDSLIEWAYDAELKIGSYKTFERKECIIKVKNNRAKLPNDFYKFISFKIAGRYPEVTKRDFRLFYKDDSNLASAGLEFNGLDLINLGSAFRTDGTNIQHSKMTIENGYIHVTGVKEEQEGGLAYMAFELDEDGLPLIEETHVDAVSAYLAWMVKFADYTNGKVAHHVYKELETRWYFLCGQARGDDEMPNPKELEYIASMYSQLLPMPSQNFF
jgi:hypothetical protein